MSLKSLAKSSLGMVEKARLIIHKSTGADEIDSKKVRSSSEGVLAGIGAVLGANPYHTMHVQYNPSSLSIQATAQDTPFVALQQNVDASVPNQKTRPPMIVLSVELIFDDVNPQDAFLMDRSRMTPGSMVSNVAGIVKAFHGGYTVQPETNALVATVLRPETSMVTFCWAGMSFTGQVIETQAQYTMFSPSGKPVRSLVRMNIAQQVESQGDVQYWEEALEGMFEDKDFFSKTLDKFGNSLLNLDAF